MNSDYDVDEYISEEEEPVNTNLIPEESEAYGGEDEDEDEDYDIGFYGSEDEEEEEDREKQPHTDNIQTQVGYADTMRTHFVGFDMSTKEGKALARFSKIQKDDLLGWTEREYSECMNIIKMCNDVQILNEIISLLAVRYLILNSDPKTKISFTDFLSRYGKVNIRDFTVNPLDLIRYIRMFEKFF